MLDQFYATIRFSAQVKPSHQCFEAGGYPVIVNTGIFCGRVRFCIASSFIYSKFFFGKLFQDSIHDFCLGACIDQAAGASVKDVYSSVAALYDDRADDDFIDGVSYIGERERRVFFCFFSLEAKPAAYLSKEIFFFFHIVYLCPFLTILHHKWPDTGICENAMLMTKCSYIFYIETT